MAELDFDTLSTLVSMSQDLDVLIPLSDRVLKNPSYSNDYKIFFSILVLLYCKSVVSFIENNNLKEI